jgi:undecaprenyl diphosphate synthase
MSNSEPVQVDPSQLPAHIAVIMDGNGRWAHNRQLPRVAGHIHGVEAVREITEGCAELGIKYLTLYAFSTENWNRPAEEVDALMGLLVDTIHKEVGTLNKNNVQLNAIGDIQKLPPATHQALLQAMQDTKQNTGLTLTLALNYSGRWEIVQAARQLAQEVKEGKISVESITDDAFSRALSTLPMPDPDLLIRTSGENRLSNFLLWQLAYAEFIFIPVLWPDFKKADLHACIAEYQQRERRFGMTGEQIKW